MKRSQQHRGAGFRAVLLVIAAGAAPSLHATPANRTALEKQFGPLLVESMRSCAVCHQRDHGTGLESLEDFPHNPFGDRLRRARQELRDAGKAAGIAERLSLVAGEDSDGDGQSNLDELLLGHQPGDGKDKPDAAEIAAIDERRAAYVEFGKRYRWEPFKPVRRPPVPSGDFDEWTRNPIDAFVAAEHGRHGLKPRTETSRETWLRRVTLDLTGLTPSAAELEAFLADSSPDDKAFAAVVDRLLASPRYGERWGRHWMDVWRYSDWTGYKAALRGSQRHIWRWRDWIVEALNDDKGYGQMLVEMLAADEIHPEDEDRLRATGYLARSFHVSNRNQWLDDVVSHSAQGFLGITMGCAKCHDHMYDDIAQEDYYRMRAIFEPYWVRTDRVPGELDIMNDGLPRVYDKNLTVKTLFFERGDERFPVKDKVLEPGLPAALGGESYRIEPVTLPLLAHKPERREFVKRDMMGAETDALSAAESKLAELRKDDKASAEAIRAAELNVAAARISREALESLLAVEAIEDEGDSTSPEWKTAAVATQQLQRQAALAKAEAKLASGESTKLAAQAALSEAKAGADAPGEAAAKKKITAVEKTIAAAKKELAAAEKAMQAEASEKFKPRQPETYPATSTGRRSGFAHWLTGRENPLTARVAMNHIWLRHFGSAIVPSVNEFGGNGRPPSHPALLDWLAAEFMERDWSMKAMHKLIVLSATYRMASTPDTANAAIDPDNRYLWRMNSRRMEGEIVRDNLLWIGGNLDTAMGGPDIPNGEALTSKRRSIYLRHGHEKLVEFVQIFDGPKPSECYRREESVQPHQALALANSPLTRDAAAGLAERLPESDAEFIDAAWLNVLGRRPNSEERALSAEFLESAERPRDRLVAVLLNHHEFVTIR